MDFDSHPNKPFSSLSGTSDLKHIKPVGFHDTDEDEESMAPVPLVKGASSLTNIHNEGDGLLKFPSTSSYGPDLSRHGSELQKHDENHHENYTDLLGFDAFQQNLKAQGALSNEVITEEDENCGQSPQKGQQLDNFTKRTMDLGVSISNDDNNNFEPISEVENQTIALNVISPDIVINSPGETGNLVSPPPQDANPPVNMTEQEMRMFNLALPETRLYVNKSMLFFGAMILTSLCVLAPLQGIAYFELIILGPFAFAFAFSIIELYMTMKVVDYLFFDSGDFFKVFDCANVIILILALQFKVAGIISTCTYISMPFFLAAHTYLFRSKGQVKKYFFNIVSRYYYGFQVIFFLLRLDGYSDWEWASVFALTWIFLAIKILMYVWNTLKILYQLLTRPYPKRITKFIGFFWYLFAQGLVFVPLLTLYGFVRYESPDKDFSILTYVALGNIGINILLLVSTLALKKYMLAFVLRLKLIRSLLVEYEMEQERLKVKKEITFEVEKKEQYFVMLSSTYFLPLHQSFVVKGKESLNKIKSMFFKTSKKNKVHNKEHRGHKEKRADSVGDVQTLKMDKVNLDAKLARLASPDIKFSGPRNTDRKNTDRLRARNTRDISDIENSTVMHEDKLALSVDDVDRVNLDISIPRPKTGNEEEDVCYLCYVNPRDVILMGCGHGGICYDCASTMVKQKNECMECRKEVDSIIKIDPNPKMLNIVKGIESHTIVVKLVSNSNNNNNTQ